MLNPELCKALEGEKPKFLATKDGNGIPNVVPVITIQPWDSETIIFGNFLLWKTEQNLRVTKEVSIAALDDSFRGAIIKGDFKGFQHIGDYVSTINSTPMMRYNAYTGIRNAGEIAVREVNPFNSSKSHLLAGNIRSRLNNKGKGLSRGKVILNPVIWDKFARIVGVKVMAFVDSKGYPVAVPVLSLQPSAPDVLLFDKKPVVSYLKDLEQDSPVAASVLTLEPMAFQVKGRYKDIDNRWGAIVLEEAYHATVPLPGKEIKPV